jgi:hypothetical protein
MASPCSISKSKLALLVVVLMLLAVPFLAQFF